LRIEGEGNGIETLKDPDGALIEANVKYRMHIVHVAQLTKTGDKYVLLPFLDEIAAALTPTRGYVYRFPNLIQSRHDDETSAMVRISGD